MENFRLVILDYPKLIIRDEATQIAFKDVICTKQINFERASELYVSMNSMDMISTHYLIYDVTNLYKPKLVLAIRTCYENRAKRHKLSLPIEDYIGYAPPIFRKKFELFRQRVGCIVDCNAHFVDPDYTFSKTGLNLSEISYFALMTFIIRKGHGNWVGATNERFKASRWALKTGFCEEGLIFTHPKVEDPHQLLLIDKFNYDWLRMCAAKYGNFVSSALEILAPNYELLGEKLLSYDEVVHSFSRQINQQSTG